MQLSMRYLSPTAQQFIRLIIALAIWVGLMVAYYFMGIAMERSAPTSFKGLDGTQSDENDVAS